VAELLDRHRGTDGDAELVARDLRHGYEIGQRVVADVLENERRDDVDRWLPIISAVSLAGVVRKACAATRPPAPVLFSTTTATPSFSRSASATSRAALSDAPPGG